ncbi:MAG: cytochrome c oxidase assembly protein [Candidatus Limnocylindria bacterium]
MHHTSRRLVALPGAAAATVAAAQPAVAHGPVPDAPALPGVLAAWSFDPLAVGLLCAAAAAYAWAVLRVNRAHPTSRVPLRRHAWFAVALASLALALLSPIERYAASLFSVHMLQHTVLEFVAAPALLLAAPVTLALRCASASVRRRLLQVLNSRAVHVASFPLIGWGVFAAVNWFWHFSTLYDQALDSPPLHYLEHATFVGAALLFWTPVVSLDPTRWRLAHPVRLLYLFLAMPQNSFLGLAIYTAGGVLFPHYASVERTWGGAPLEDQQLAGVLMWVGGDVAFLVAMVAVVAAWMRYEERRTARMDARLDRLSDVSVDAPR